MNDLPNQPDPIAMSPTDVETSPELDSLLDEALSPQAVTGGVPEGLADRVFTATVNQLPSAQREAESAVIGRIESGSTTNRLLTLRRIAAVLVLFAWVGAAYLIFTIVSDAKTNVQNLAAVEDVLEHVARTTPESAVVAPEVEPIDTALDQLEVDIELAVSSTTTSWEELTAEFEAELDALDPGDPGA